MHLTRKSALISLGFLVVASTALLGFRQQTGQVTRAQLRDILVQLGYDVKDLDATAGKEKYSVTVQQDGLNIPVAYELSANDTFIWLTVNLGVPPAETSATNAALLKSNADIQPAMFYVTKSGKLMMGLPVENHEITNASIRARTTTLLDHVTGTKDIWQVAP